MKKIIFFFLIILIVFSNTQTSFAAQISGEPIVTEKTITATVNTDVTSVTLEVYDQQGKKVAGPSITKGESPIKATIDVYNLSRGTTYELRGKDSVSVFTTNFKTVTQDTRVSGSGDWYYSVGIILANYDNAREKSMFRFTTEKLCNTSRTSKIDELFQATSVAGGGVKNSTITPCFKSTTIPLKKDFESKLQSIDGMAGSKSLYYFTYGYKTDKLFNRSMGYITLKECEEDQELYKDRLVMKCTASTTAPTEPTNWNSLLDAQGVDPVNIKNFEEDYTLLAPIGDTTKIDGTTKVGDYLNTILLIAIGLCGALAVIMIVIYGVQYMGDESVFGKTEAKSHIVAAIMGLLLALGAYAILNTINPNLVGGSLTFNSVNITISAEDTSTGSSKTLCISQTNPPNPDTATGSTVTLNASMQEYQKEINKLTTISTGKKLLMTAQTATEGFYPGSKSYRTNNPGNIGNTDDGKTKSFATLAEGIQAQATKVVSGKGSYQIGGKSTCALGSEPYDGSLYQYLRIYSTGARMSNAYVNAIIGHFKANGKIITARTKMDVIYNMK